MTLKLLIKLCTKQQSDCVSISLQSTDPLISEILAEAKLTVLPTSIANVVFGQGTAFLALPKGPLRLNENKRASDYLLTDGTILWLMCSSVIPESE